MYEYAVQRIFVQLRFKDQKRKCLRARATGDKEFAHAQNLQTDGRMLTRSFMDNVRLGRAIDVQTVEARVSCCVLRGTRGVTPWVCSPGRSI